MKYEYWFANIKGISNRRKIEIREQISAVEALYYGEERWMRELGLSDKERIALTESIKTWNLEEEYGQVIRKQINCVSTMHPDYPPKLLDIQSPPYMLYVNGKLPDPEKKTVAIVGARGCSIYGEIASKTFAKALAKEGVQIVSGMAMGIDSIGQRAALQAGGSSFAVLGCGVDYCYPREEYELYMELPKKGGVISEYPVNTKPFKSHFPARNRIISGLADAIIVMEAKERSGSLITADMALEQGKDVYALPGPINSALSKGCNYLIKQGAGILTSPEELLFELGISSKNVSQFEEAEKNLLETTEKLVYSCLDLHPQNLNELVRKTQLSVPELLDVLVRLELWGMVREISKNYYVRS